MPYFQRPARISIATVAFMLFLAAVLIPRTSTLATAATTAPDASSPYGVAGVMRWPDWGTFGRPADVMLETGGSWVREDFVWGLIEPRENVWDWTATDRITGELHARKLNVLGILSYAVNWATPSKADDASSSPVSFYAPDNSKFYWYVRTMVSRYKDTIHHWEVWNEPDNNLFWKPAPNAHEYSDLLKTAYRAVKDADPTAKVVTAGVSGNAVPFLEELMANGAGGSFDILGLHPYAVPLDLGSAKQQSRPEVHKMVDVELEKYRAFLERHSLKRPIWVTEVGWPAGSWQLDAQSQADYLAQAYAQMLASGILERIFWYSFKDESAAPSDSWGLVGWGSGATDLTSRRPSFAAYSTSARMLSAAKPVGRIQAGNVQTVEGFELGQEWTRSMNAVGTLTISTERRHSGASAGMLAYSFSGANQAVDFAPKQTLPLQGNPVRLGLWVLGDSSGNYLSAWLKDRDGELFKVRLGAVGAVSDGWTYYEARINEYHFDWEHALGNPANAAVDYPVSFVGFRLENTPDEPAGSGAFYVDDLQATVAPDVSAVRFARADGQIVDVLWSVEPQQVRLPSGSAAQVVDRDGTARTVELASGALQLNVSSAPIYVVHKPAEPNPAKASTAVLGSGTSTLQRTVSPACAAARPIQQANDAATLYFAQTSHSLGGVFRRFWVANGGLGGLGFPLTEEFTATSSDGKEYKQQFFERARMEFHPENSPPNDVQLGLLGSWLAGGRLFDRVSAQATGGALYFPQTSHSITRFKDWWQAHGGVAVFGFPISQEMQEKNSADGKVYTVQYFERNRLELHPENAGHESDVLLGLLGAEFLSSQGCPR